jgi:16S rRNA (cytosine1402-N4)-methyltransferase
LLDKFSKAKLYGIDRDPTALAASRHRLAHYPGFIAIEQASFTELSYRTEQWNTSFDFILADLGMSSEQLAAPERGFSFLQEGPLDMRMDPLRQVETAAQILQQRSEFEIRKLLQIYGEERFAPQIARAIVRYRAHTGLVTTSELAELVERVIPRKFQKPNFHPATQTFQALRMEVNQEPEEVNALLDFAIEHLRPGGRLAVISFHSLEDRPVKQRFREWEQPCRCPSDLPRCVCGLQALGFSLKRKPIVADAEEIGQNPRSRSARLRVFERNAIPFPGSDKGSED